MFNPARHYPLLQRDWDADVAQQTIESIVGETIAQLKHQAQLPAHPLDEGGFGSDLYFGKAGVLWAIHYVQAVGAIESSFDVLSELEAALEQNRQRYAKASPYPEQSSYLFGELPLLLLQYKLSPTEDKTADLWRSIHQNDDQL